MAEQIQQAKKPTYEEIAARSYLLWEKEGRPHGRDMDYWLHAEAELTGNRKSSSENSKKLDGTRKKKSFV